MKTINDLSVCDLVHELIRGGNADLVEFEPIDVQSVVKNLETKTNRRFGRDIEKWVVWFCSETSNFSHSEKELIKIVKQLVDAEKKYIPMIKKNNLE